MVARRAPRPFWIPSLAWPFLVAVGAWWMMGMRWSSTRVAEEEWFVRVVWPAPSGWLQSRAALVGLVLLVLGIIAWWASFAQPDPARWRPVVARFPEFAIAGHLLALMAFLSVVRLDAHVFDLGTSGMQWRAIAAVRSLPNLFVAGGLTVAALACYTLSFGPRARIVQARPAS